MKNTGRIFLRLILLFPYILFADLASPEPIDLIQPDGTRFVGVNRGNHLQGWIETNGWSIIQDNNGWWVYATGADRHTLVPSTQKVGIDPEPDQNESLNNIYRHLKPEPRSLIDEGPVPNIRDTRIDTFFVPLLLVDFPDHAYEYPMETFEDIMNLEGYTYPGSENSGSFRDFYQEISYGEFLPHSIIADWVRAPNDHDHYAYSNPDGYAHVRQLVRYVVDTVEDQGFDWSIFDNDGDGNVDAMNLIHAGPGAEEGDYANIWSHKWNLGNNAVEYDGVQINSYTMNPEIQSGTIVAIGVLCHEFGHALGLPDLYDTDYSSSGAGKLALMASGSWGTSNTSPWYPSAMNAWCKNQLGWVDIIELADDQSGITIERTYSSNQVYRMNHPTVPDEYWLIENRQKAGTDTLMPQPGLTIWHISDDITSGWSPNNNEPYYGVGLEQADGLFALENGGPSDGGDVYPGTSDNREFSHSSMPNTTSLYGDPSMNRIENISDPGIVMTFDLSYNDIILADIELQDGTGYANQPGNFGVDINNDMNLGNLSLTLAYNSLELQIVDILPAARTSFDSVIIAGRAVSFQNLNIYAGSGPAFDIVVMNYTGAPTIVEISIHSVSAHMEDGAEVGMVPLGSAQYTILGIDQVFNIQDGTGAIGGGASFSVSLTNTVPIQFFIMNIMENPNLLTASDEPFTDMNGNGEWDNGEEYQDWNGNGTWSTVIELSDRTIGWSIDVQESGNNMSVSGTNWSEPLEPGTGPIFTINTVVGPDAQIDETITITTDVWQLMDAWGHTGVPFQNGSGTVLIDQILKSNDGHFLPKDFSLYNVYPNPFNPINTLQFSVPTNKTEPVRIFVYDITGRMVLKLTDQIYDPGHYQLTWDGSGLGSGIYFIDFQARDTHQFRKISLVK